MSACDEPDTKRQLMELSSHAPTSLPNPPNDFYYDDDFYMERGLYVSEILDMWNLSDIIRELGTNDQCVEFSEQEGLVLKEKKCSRHRTPMKISFSSSSKSFGMFICSKGTCRIKGGGSSKKIARRKGTFFENITLDLVHVYYLIYTFSRGWSYDYTIHEDPYKNKKLQCLSSNTISDWYSYFRELVIIYYIENPLQFTGKIGGPGKIVQIDESKFGKRKHNIGLHIEGYWLLGLIEIGSKDLRLEVCSENISSTEVLIPVIKKHIEVGTTIHTGCWQAYDCLQNYGYNHKKVNQSHPDKPSEAEDGTNTQIKGSQWRVIKEFCQTKHYNSRGYTENLADLAIEYVWRRNLIKFKRDGFLELMASIKHTHKVN